MSVRVRLCSQNWANGQVGKARDCKSLTASSSLALPSNKIRSILWETPGQNDELREYLWNEFRYNVQKKYYKYFDDWYINITETQRTYFEAYMRGHKSPY